jgi:hypothetical protein
VLMWLRCMHACVRHLCIPLLHSPFTNVLPSVIGYVFSVWPCTQRHANCSWIQSATSCWAEHGWQVRLQLCHPCMHDHARFDSVSTEVCAQWSCIDAPVAKLLQLKGRKRWTPQSRTQQSATFRNPSEAVFSLRTRSFPLSI